MTQALAAAATAGSATPATGSTSGTASTTAATTPATSSPNFSTLFPVSATTTAPATPAAAAAPTAQSVFGANPWDTNPTGSGPTGTFTYNPYYFATEQTAADVASMVGGKVVEMNAVGGPSGNPFVQNQPNEMVQLANGALINPGLVASFYTHGYPQSMVNQMISNEVTNVSSGT